MQNETALPGLKVVGFIDPRLLTKKTSVQPAANKGLAKIRANKIISVKMEAESQDISMRIGKLFK